MRGRWGTGAGARCSNPFTRCSVKNKAHPPQEAFADIWVSISKYKNEMKGFLDFLSKPKVSKRTQGKQTNKQQAQDTVQRVLSHLWKPWLCSESPFHHL